MLVVVGIQVRQIEITAKLWNDRILVNNQDRCVLLIRYVKEYIKQYMIFDSELSSDFCGSTQLYLDYKLPNSEGNNGFLVNYLEVSIQVELVFRHDSSAP